MQTQVCAGGVDMKRVFVLAMMLVVVTSLTMAGSDGLLQGVGQISVNRADPGEGGTDCTYLNNTVYYNWIPIKEWRGGFLCEGAYQCKRGSAVLGLTSAGAWAIPLPQARTAAAAGFAAAVTAGQICTWVETLSCGPEDRYIEVGKKRKFKVYIGEEYTPGRCRARLDIVDWQKEYYR